MRGAIRTISLLTGLQGIRACNLEELPVEREEEEEEEREEEEEGPT